MIVVSLPNPSESTQAYHGLHVVRQLLSADSLPQFRAHPSVAVIAPNMTASSVFQAACKRHGFSCLPVDTLHVGSVLSRKRIRKQLAPLLTRLQAAEPRLLLSFSSSCLRFADYLAHLTATPLVATVEPESKPTGSLRSHHLRIITATPASLAAYQQLYATEHAQHRAASEGNRQDSNRHVYAIAPGVDCNRFDPKKLNANRVEALISRLNLREDESLLVIPFVPPKHANCKAFFAALHHLKSQGFERIRCLVTSPAELSPKSLQPLIAASKKARSLCRIEKLAHWEDLPTLYAVCALVVRPWPTRSHMSQAFLEAQAMGRQVLSISGPSDPVPQPELHSELHSDLHSGAPTPAVPQFALEINETGAIVPASNPALIAQELRNLLLRYQQERNSIAARCRNHVQTRHNISQTCGRYRDVITQLLQSLPSPIKSAQ